MLFEILMCKIFVCLFVRVVYREREFRLDFMDLYFRAFEYKLLFLFIIIQGNEQGILVQKSWNMWVRKEESTKH